MGTAKTAIGTLALLIFVVAIAARPILSNPALTAIDPGAPLGGVSPYVYVPVLLVAVALFALRVRSLIRRRNRTTSQDSSPDSGFDSSSVRDDAREGTTDDQTAEGTSGASETGEDSEPNTETESDTGGTSKILGGQGGTRDRSFEIEHEPPEVELDAHLEHLRAEFGDETAELSDAETLEELVARGDDERTIPPRCPQQYCDAAWTDGGILGFGGGNYEVIEDGIQIRCTECEQITTFD